MRKTNASSFQGWIEFWPLGPLICARSRRSSTPPGGSSRRTTWAGTQKCLLTTLDPYKTQRTSLPLPLPSFIVWTLSSISCARETGMTRLVLDTPPIPSNSSSCSEPTWMRMGSKLQTDYCQGRCNISVLSENLLRSPGNHPQRQTQSLGRKQSTATHARHCGA